MSGNDVFKLAEYVSIFKLWFFTYRIELISLWEFKIEYYVINVSCVIGKKSNNNLILNLTHYNLGITMYFSVKIFSFIEWLMPYWNPIKKLKLI